MLITAASWVKKFGRARTLQFSDRRLKISERGYKDAYNFTFAHKFLRNGGF